ncbi:SusC/RagA family TonB-linked outer membrane protein [Chitinophaga nivalis]|uniref:SusC/RagA family TonB-linked outer membrane protein n=1 Tax=Chitinophaga nivalis TaxID=2991709 RepID=A0ABT3IPK1_9BACT|nr:SusC/RagA family TonB-linked outer membrane protein [Chitinophaga nivalis]MCW3485898.1 SusC/RagA family TonB-linked outer membrane protein [Chitinophaga nivalis]
MAVYLHTGIATMAQMVSYTGNKAALSDVFTDIKKQTGYVFFYRKALLDNSHPVTVTLKNAPLIAALEQILLNQPLTFSIENKTIFIHPKSTAKTDQATDVRTGITGTVQDETGKPLAGVSVFLKGSKSRAVTDESGQFILKDDGTANVVLLFTMIGYEQQEVAIGNRTRISVQLKMAIGKIGEVEVMGNTGYQKIPRERATGAFDVIGPRQLSNRVQTNVLERLEGQVPGLLLMKGRDNGDPNGDGLTIRGVSTLYGTKRPLIVIDNFPFEGSMESINPNDVASITILKDAAAASIWGARAANGVIVITTKTAKKGKIQFTYNNNFMFENKPDLGYLNRLTAGEDIAINRQLLTPGMESNIRDMGTAFSALEGLYMDSVAGRITPAQYAHDIAALSQIDNSRQIRQLLMKAPFTQNHSLSFMGGSEKNSYYGSLRYTDASGYALQDRHQGYSFLIKDNYHISPRLSFNVSANLTYTNATTPAVMPEDIYRLKPYQQLQDAQGNPLPFSRDADNANQNNSNAFSIAQRKGWGLDDESYYPLNESNLIENNTNNIYNRIQAELKYALFPGVDVNISYQLENGYTYNKVYTHSNEPSLVKEINDFIVPERDAGGNILTNTDGTLLNPTYNIPKGGKIREQRNNFSAYTLRALVSINRQFGDDHDLAVVVGAERRQSKSNGNTVTKYGYNDNSLQFVDVDVQRLKNLTGNLQSIQNGFNGIGDRFNYTEDRFVSAFGNAAYTFRKKYVLSGSIRMDVTNMFGTDPKYLYRPMWSAGGSWILSNESFMEPVHFVDQLQLRATYGLNGNIPKTSGPFMIATSSTNWLNNLPANTITTPANNTLRWERTAVTNLGIDYTLLDNRISGKVDYYIRKSSDLLGDQQINPTLGFTTATVNTASMTNKGWELQLTTKNIRSKNFEWSTTLIYAHNKSEITKISLNNNFNTPQALAAGNPYVLGDPYGALYSFRFGGLSPDKGQIQILDPNGKIARDEYYRDLNMVYYTGTTRPINNGAISNNFTYKGFDLNLMFVFYADYVARQSLPEVYKGPGAYDSRLKDAWKRPGDERSTIIPNVIKNNSNYYANVYYSNYLDVNVFDATYIKLRDVSLRYTFQQRALKRWRFIRGLQLMANARNILTITTNKAGIDPEAFANGVRTMPVMPSYSFGINLDF